MDRYQVEKGKRGATTVYTVVDTLKGTIAKTAITDKPRAERIAARLNERVADPFAGLDVPFTDQEGVR